jgi:hypothetical protein
MFFVGKRAAFVTKAASVGGLVVPDEPLPAALDDRGAGECRCVTPNVRT